MTQSKKIAVTGGIGSGKSSFCNLLRKRGYPVFSCDEIQRGFLQDRQYLQELQKLFPDCFIKGVLQKPILAEKIFSSPQERKKMEEFSHPRIMQVLMEKMRPHAVSFAEVPLLYEGGFEKLFDGVIALLRKDEARIASVIRRDGLTEEEICNRMRSQISPENLKGKRCIFVENNGSVEELERKAVSVLKQLTID